MEIKIDVDNDFCDEIVAARLLGTYASLSKDIKEKNWGELDLQQFACVVAALEVVGPWFVYDWDKKKTKVKL
jgi:hypothetical protein